MDHIWVSMQHAHYPLPYSFDLPFLFVPPVAPAALVSAFALVFRLIGGQPASLTDG
jgi:hypothetical protein